MKSLEDIVRSKYRGSRSHRKQNPTHPSESARSQTPQSGSSETRSLNHLESGFREGSSEQTGSITHPREFLKCLEPNIPEALWDSGREETYLLARLFMESQYYTRGHGLKPRRRYGRAFREQVETLLQKGADPNMTIKVYEASWKVVQRVSRHFPGMNRLSYPFLTTPFLESIALGDTEMMVLFLRHGVNAQDLTRHFKIVKLRNGISDFAGLLSISHRFQSVRDFVTNVDIFQDKSLKTWLMEDIQWTLRIIHKDLDITYDGINIFSPILKLKINEKNPSKPLSGTVWSHSCEPLTTAECPHVRDKIFDLTQGISEPSRALTSTMCSMCQLVVGNRPHITAYPMPRPKVSLSLQHILETQRWELLSRFNDTERRHAVRSVPSGLYTTINEISSLGDQITGSLAAAMLSKYWLVTCTEAHVICSRNGRTYIPTRLVEIVSDGLVRLVEYMPSTQMYAALSHRWSQDEASKTTSLNFADRLAPFRTDQLSRTIHDSVKSAQSLGYRYMWIDVLCIIQDSEQDWLHEAAEMRHVYSNAVITIAAECAEEGTAGEGTPSPRDLNGFTPFPLHELERYTDENLEHLFQSAKEPDGKRWCIFPNTGEYLYANRPKGVLDTRGWILQEQLLSPRILYYSHEQLYWDCISQSASEVSPEGVSLLVDAHSGETWAFRLLRRTIAGKGDPELLAKLIADVWIHVVQNYSARTLTRQSDKLIALQGVVAALESVLQLSSVAGMWQQGLWKQLMWWTATPAIDADHVDSPFSAPTWSWLSVDGAVNHHHSMRLHGDPIELDDLAPLPGLRCTVTNIHAEPTSVSALLDLSATSFSYMLTANDLREMTWKWGHPGKLNLAPARWMLDRKLELPLEMQCVIIAEDEVAKMTVGMCLAADDSQPDTWKRVGVFLWDGLTWKITKYARRELQTRHFAVI